jgi:hypothetical protein
MPVVADEKYTRERMEMLKEYVQTYYDMQEPFDYLIYVDGFPAVRRTANPKFFDNFIENFDRFVNPNSKVIEVLFYQGTSNNNEKHIFRLKEEEPKDKGLSGIEIENKIQDEIKREKEKWDTEQLKDRNKELEKEVEELEDELDKLEKEMLEIKAKESPMKGFLGEFGSTMLESFIRRNPQMLLSLPGGKALAGFIEEDNKKLSESKEPIEYAEPVVSFRASDEEPKNKEAEEALNFVKYMKGRFSQSQFGKLMQVIDMLAITPEKIDNIFENLKKGGTDGNAQV